MAYNMPGQHFFGRGPHQYFDRMSGATPESFISMIITCYSMNTYHCNLAVRLMHDLTDTCDRMTMKLIKNVLNKSVRKW